MRAAKLSRAGFTLVEMMIVVVIIGLLVAIAIPNLYKSRTTAQRTACIKNLQQIDGAKERWALEFQMPQNSPVNEAQVDGYLKVAGDHPFCPANGKYTYGDVGQPPTCDAPGHVLPAP